MVRVSRGLATIKYRIYKPGAVSFESFKETEETQTMQYRTSELDKVHEQWQQAQGTVNAAIYKQKMTLINASKVIDVDLNDPDRFDLSDIDAIFAAEGREDHDCWNHNFTLAQKSQSNTLMNMEKRR